MADAGAVDAAAAAATTTTTTPAGPPRRPMDSRAALLPSRLSPGAAPTCARCGRPARRPRDCEHTGWAVHCTECYVEIHYYLNEPAAGADAG